MTTSLGFTSADFRIESATSIAPAMVRVRFTTDPKQVSPAGSTDGLNPVNYQVSGPSSPLVVGVNPVPDDPQSLDLFMSSALVGGTYTLLVLGVVAEDGGALVGANTTSFAVSATAPQDAVNGGAQDILIEDTLKQFLGPALSGENWDALAYALSTGDTYVSEQARNLFDQLFKVSASGRYLDRLAGEEGVRRPENVGMSDELFRELAIRMSTAKVTYDALWRLLEIFYGSDAVRSVVETEIDEPYAIQDGTQLLLEFDGSSTQIPVTFRNADFSTLGAARAIEVAAVITRQIRQLGVQGWATAVLNPVTQRYRVRIFSPSLGLASRVRVVGGMAQNKLRFPDVVDEATPVIGTSYSVSLPALGTAVYNILGLATPLLSAVQIGDYVNINASSLSAVNKGSFVVTDVSVVWGGATYTQSFTVKNQLAIAQAGPFTTLTEEDFVFFRAANNALPSTQALISGAQDDTIVVELPASTVVVAREPYDAAYLQGNTPVAISQAALSTDGVLSVTTADAHGLSPGNHILIDGLFPNLFALPVTAGNTASAGNPGTTASAQTILTDTLRAPDSFAGRALHSMTTMPNGRIMLLGGQTVGPVFSAGATTIGVTGTTVNPDGRTAYLYNYFDVADASTPIACHAAVATNKRLGPGILRICGLTTGSVASSTIEFYSQTLDSWSAVPNAVHPACYYNLAIPVVDASSEEVFILSGGQTGAATGTASTSRIETSTGAAVLVAGPTDTAVRSRHAGCAIDANTALWCGGGDPTASLAPLASTFAVKYDGTTVSCGPLAVARVDHTVVAIGNGQALAIGGSGRVLSRESSNRAVGEIELFSLSTCSWTTTARLNVARINPVVFQIGTKIYIVGGDTQIFGIPTSTIEVYDIETRTVQLVPSTATLSTQFGVRSAVFPSGFAIINGGGIGGGGFVTTTTALIPGSLFLTGANSLNRLLKVATVPSGTTFTVTGLPTGDNARTDPGGSEAQVTKVTAPAVNTPIGPYIWDTDNGPALTNVSALVQVAIPINSQIGVLTVDDATDFPDEEGWLAFNAGYNDQEYPVKYLGRISDTQLAIDFEHRFEHAIDVNSTVELLTGKGALDLDGISERGSAYITDASAGRVAAEQFLRDAIMCGPELNIIVKYPSDVGLGNAGSPYAGLRKLSDAIRVWGGNELTSEVEAAVLEDDLND